MHSSLREHAVLSWTDADSALRKQWRNSCRHAPARPAAAQQKLQECEEVIDNDYFLAACKDEFVENARVFTFESYCRIHQVSLAGSVGVSHKLCGIGCSMSSSKGSSLLDSATPLPGSAALCLARHAASHGYLSCMGFTSPGTSHVRAPLCLQCIDLRQLAEKLAMDEDAAEKWMVNPINNSRRNAKIDSQAGTVVMSVTYPTAYDQILEKARDLSMRTFALANSLNPRV